jgi:hypothetical protein
MTSSHLTMLSHLTNTDRAAWGLVFGAICAIAAVLYAVWLRPRAALKARRKRIMAIAAAGLMRAKRMGEGLARPGPIDISSLMYVFYNQSIIDGIVQALTSVPAPGSGSRDAAVALSSLRDQFRFLGTSIEIFDTPPTTKPATIQRLLALDEAKRREYLAGRQPILAKNVRDRVAIIQKDYEALAQVLNHSAAPATGKPWRGWLLIATSFFVFVIIVAAVVGCATARR